MPTYHDWCLEEVGMMRYSFGLRVGVRTSTFAYALFTAALLMLLQLGGAQGIDFAGILGAIPDTICNAGNFLRGPIGFGIVALIFFIGIIRFLAGNRGGLGLIITAMVGGLVLIAAPQILTIFTADGCAIG